MQVKDVEDFDAKLSADPNNGVLLWTGFAELLLNHPKDFTEFEIVRSLLRWCQNDSITRMTLEWVIAWVECGRPQIEVGEKLAASLALTRVPEEVAASTPLPYPAFLVRIPDGLLIAEGAKVQSGGREEVLVDLSIAMVRQTTKDQLTVVFASRRSATLWMRVSADFGEVFGKDPTPDLPASWDGMVFENSSQDKIAHKAQAKGQGEMLMKLRCACGETTPMLSTAIHTAPLFQVCQELGWQLQLAGVDTIYKCPTCVERHKQEVLPSHPLRDGNVVIVVQEPPVPSVPFSRTYFALLVTNCTQALVAGEWLYTCAVYVDGSPVDVYRGEYFAVKTEGDRRYLKHPSGKVSFLVKALVRD